MQKATTTLFLANSSHSYTTTWTEHWTDIAFGFFEWSSKEIIYSVDRFTLPFTLYTIYAARLLTKIVADLIS